MTRSRQLLPSPLELASLFVLGLVASAIVLIATAPYGPGVSPDAVGYLATARHIAGGAGAITYDGRPLVDQPPLYPLLLAAVQYLSGLQALSVAQVVNAALFALMVCLSGFLFLEHLPTPFAILATASVVVAVPLVRVSLMAWSEPLFVVATLCYLLGCRAYLRNANVQSVLFMSASVAAACLTRYIGVVLIPAGWITMLFVSDLRLRTRLTHLLVFTAAAAAPLALWLVRNYVVSGTLVGARAPSGFGFVQNLTRTAGTVLWWIFPQTLSAYPVMAVLFVTAVVISGAIAARGKWPRMIAVTADLWPFLVLTAVYVGGLLASATTTAFDTIGDRLLSPVWLPITLVLQVVMFALVAAPDRRLSPARTTLTLIAAAAIWLVYPTVAAVEASTYSRHEGRGYTSPAWRNSPMVDYLRRDRLDAKCPVYTNVPEALYFLADMRSKISPSRTMYNSPQKVDEAARLTGAWPEEETACLVWALESARLHLFSVDELRAIASLRQIQQFEDGSIYVVTRRRAP